MSIRRPLTGPIGFNAQHSPMGAFMSFTCGNPGTKGRRPGQASFDDRAYVRLRA